MADGIDERMADGIDERMGDVFGHHRRRSAVS
jgi:hypothetical protein